MTDNGRGWLKLDRKITESVVFHDAEVLLVWIWILCNAAYEEHDTLCGKNVITLKPGQIITGRKKLADKLEMSESKVYRCLQILEELGNISILTNSKFSVITVEKWADYQGCNSESEQQSAVHLNSKRTANEQQTNSKRTQQKKDKKGKEYNNIYLDPRAHAREESSSECEVSENFSGNLSENSAESEKSENAQPKNAAGISESAQKKEYAPLVRLTDEEYRMLCEKYGEKTARMLIDFLSERKKKSGKDGKYDFRSLITWVADAMKEKPWMFESHRDESPPSECSFPYKLDDFTEKPPDEVMKGDE